MMQLGVERRPERFELIEIDAHVLPGQVLIGVEDDLEPVSVHAPAWMPLGHVGQLVRGLETEPAPHVDMVGAVEVGALIARALDSDGRQTRHRETLTNPACQVLVRGDRKLGVEVLVIKLVDARASRKAVPMQAPRAVPLGKDGDPAGGLEGGGGQMEESLGHLSLRRSGSAGDRPVRPRRSPWRAVGRSRTDRRVGNPPQGHSNCW